MSSLLPPPPHFSLLTMTLHRRPDWVKCRNWLGDITPTSARSVKPVSSERELFLYLKDGTELCRIVGFLTNGKVPEEILYRTQNIR